MDDEVVTGFLKSGTIKNNSEKRAILDQRKNNTPNVAHALHAPANGRRRDLRSRLI